MDSDFKCPKCGSGRWGSTNCTGPGPIVRHCNGYLPDGTSCSFSWPQTDDLKYGIQPVEHYLSAGRK